MRGIARAVVVRIVGVFNAFEAHLNLPRLKAEGTQGSQVAASGLEVSSLPQGEQADAPDEREEWRVKDGENEPGQGLGWHGLILRLNTTRKRFKKRD